MRANRGRSRPPPARSLRYHRTRSIGVRTGRPARPAAHSAVADLPVRDGRPDSAVPLSFRLCVFGWCWWWLSIRSQWRLRRRQAGATGHPPPARRRRSLRPRHRVRRTAGGRLHEEGGPWRRGRRAGPPGPRLRRARLFRRGCGLRRTASTPIVPWEIVRGRLKRSSPRPLLGAAEAAEAYLPRRGSQGHVLVPTGGLDLPRLGDRGGEAAAVLCLASAHADRRRWDQALTCAQESLNAYWALGDHWVRPRRSPSLATSAPARPPRSKTSLPPRGGGSALTPAKTVPLRADYRSPLRVV